MSTILNTNGKKLDIPHCQAGVAGTFYVVTAQWNSEVTHTMRDAAVNVLEKAGVDPHRIVCLHVPGTVELVNAAAMCLNKSGARTGSGSEAAVEGIIIIGCVIRGDTPHFDYVCQIAADGAARLNAIGTTPVIFSVLTVENQQQALDRAGGILGNKGAEAACAAIEMANMHALFNRI